MVYKPLFQQTQPTTNYKPLFSQPTGTITPTMTDYQPLFFGKEEKKSVFDDTELGKLKRSIAEQESKGDYKAIGAMTKYGKALGKYQIIPKFHFEKIELKDTAEDRTKFLNSPELQDKLFNTIIDELNIEYKGNQRQIAAAYYGGGFGAVVVDTKLGDKPQENAPSINEYVNSVVSRVMKQSGAEWKKAPSFLASLKSRAKELLGLTPGRGEISRLGAKKELVFPAPYKEGIIPEGVKPIGYFVYKKIPLILPKTKLEKAQEIITLPVRWTAGYLARFLTSFAFEKTKTDLEYIPKQRWEELLIGEEPIRRMAEDTSLIESLAFRFSKEKLKQYGFSDLLANNTALVASGLIGAFIENPFFIGIGKSSQKILQKSLIEIIEKETGERIGKESVERLGKKAEELLAIKNKSDREFFAKRIVKKEIEAVKGIKEVKPKIEAFKFYQQQKERKQILQNYIRSEQGAIIQAK